MGTWLAHLRIAELLLDGAWSGRAFAPDAFLVGSVAPDAGKQVVGGYEPPQSVSHWLEPGGWPQAAENFRRGYLEPRLAGAGSEVAAASSMAPAASEAGRAEVAFLAGYLVHLRADALFREFSAALFGPGKWDDPEFQRDLGADGAVLDRMYLVNHPDSVFFTRFMPLGASTRDLGASSYAPYDLPWFGPGRVAEHVAAVARRYGEPKPIPHHHVFHYLTDADMTGYIYEAAESALATLADLAPLLAPIAGPGSKPSRR